MPLKLSTEYDSAPEVVIRYELNLIPRVGEDEREPPTGISLPVVQTNSEAAVNEWTREIMRETKNENVRIGLHISYGKNDDGERKPVRLAICIRRSCLVYSLPTAGGVSRKLKTLLDLDRSNVCLLKDNERKRQRDDLRSCGLRLRRIKYFRSSLLKKCARRFNLAKKDLKKPSGKWGGKVLDERKVAYIALMSTLLRECDYLHSY